MPTPERTFAQNANLSAMIRLYPRTTPVTESVVLKTVILDGRDRLVFEASDTLKMSDLAGGFAEHRLSLPLARLAPGPYLLRFEVGRPSSQLQSRDVRFEVR